MSMHAPSRPGAMVGNIIEELGVSVADAARRLGIAPATLRRLINNDNASVSPEMAVRLEAVFGSTAGNWLRMQANYDAKQISQHASKISKGLKPYTSARTATAH